MSKHTPGPWTVEHDGPSLPIIMGRASSGFIAFIKDANDEPVEIEANANLIAAAPELLEALRDLLWHTPESEEKQIAPWFNKARAAIAKAEGR